MAYNADPVTVFSPEDIFKNIQQAQRRVHLASTNKNERSSRSHTILMLQYKEINLEGSEKTAKLNLVDLAGSENVKETGATGIVLKEAGKINQSLTVLSLVISKLISGESHIPYKDSKLTHLLSESLGGNSRTTVICTARRAKKNTH